MPEYVSNEMIDLLSQQTKLLEQIYVSNLFVIGVVSAVAVCLVLYKFLREFF